MHLNHTPKQNAFIRRFFSFFLSLMLLTTAFFPYVRAADTTYVIPGDDKLFALVSQSTNGHNTAQYLFLDHHQEATRVYIVFEVRSDKTVKSATVEIDGEQGIIDLTLVGTYDTLTLEDSETIRHTSGSKLVWQIAYFEHADLLDGSQICISATTGAGGFDLSHVEHILQVKYGLTVSKVLVTVNGQPAQDPVLVDIGDEIGWHILVKNSGDIDLTGITVEDKLPGTVLDHTGSFDLAAGETKTILATYVVQPSDAGKQIINVVAATTDHGLAEGGTSSASDINYAVIYDSNGGTNAPDLQMKYTDVDVSISDGVPTREGYEFTGWNTAADGSGTTYAAGALYTQNANLTLYAQWKQLFRVRFHANLPGVDESVFRTYYPTTGTLPAGAYALTQSNTVETFYDIPEFDYDTHNRYIFKGWYLADGTPIGWSDTYTQDTDIYAHWIETGTVAQSADDGKQLPAELGGAYPGYELVGIQLRGEESDYIEHYGEVGSGLRYISVLSQSVYSQINALPGNEAGAEYGFVLAKATSVPEGAQLMYKGSNVNGKNTTASHSFVVNVKCSGVPDHFSNVGQADENAYRLYTAVVTFKSAAAKGDAALQEAYARSMVARAYIRYYDANGLLRVYHSNYAGSSRVGNGCSTSYNQALDILQRQ